MRHEFQARMPEGAHSVKVYIGDVRNKRMLKYAKKGVDYVFQSGACPSAIKVCPLVLVNELE